MRAAICGLNAEGASGPNGIPVFFYKDCWARVGPDVMALMEEFYAGTSRTDHINRAYITLLPKTLGAERVGDFRPISLSNSIYLIIAKCLPTDSESCWGPSSAPSNLLLSRVGRWQIVLSSQRRSSLLGEGWAPPVSYGRLISPKHMIPWIGA